MEQISFHFVSFQIFFIAIKHMKTKHILKCAYFKWIPWKMTGQKQINNFTLNWSHHTQKVTQCYS